MSDLSEANVHAMRAALASIQAQLEDGKKMTVAQNAKISSLVQMVDALNRRTIGQAVMGAGRGPTV